MKTISIFFISALMCLNIYGQSTYSGKIIYISNPCQTEPCMPGIVFGLETTTNNFVLTMDSNWIWSNNKLFVENVEYFLDDEVEITGTTTTKQDINSNEYTELEIKTIKKLTLNVESVSFSNNEVYYDATKQVIVIDEILQNKSITFELVDIQGKVILRRRIGVGNNSSICVANLSDGIYLYRLLQKSQTLCAGKIIKNN